MTSCVQILVFLDKLDSMYRYSVRGFCMPFQVLESQAPFLKSSDWFALLEGLGKQKSWTLTLEVPSIILLFTDAELWTDISGLG